MVLSRYDTQPEPENASSAESNGELVEHALQPRQQPVLRAHEAQLRVGARIGRLRRGSARRSGGAHGRTIAAGPVGSGGRAHASLRRRVDAASTAERSLCSVMSSR